ncbi:hypothetical protein [Sphingomonas sp. DT-204]|uniref:hypothetical protein n=1 Tax=Sphingomonas sp. DT-204 TaxID=3396166 RepID=UPI003F1D38FA
MPGSIAGFHISADIMPDVRLPLLLLTALAVPGAAGAAGGEQRRQAASGRETITEVTIQQRLVIRIPRLPVGRASMPAAPPAAPLPPIRWVERKADKCVPVETLAGATIAGTDRVDLLLLNGKRLRARFGDDCPALDFYSGLYVRMNPDGKVCASRDSIRSRAGGECRIESFRALVPSR